MSVWVDYKKVKETVDMQMVIDCYAVTGMVRNGDELRGPCPIHKGAKRDKNFKVNIRKNGFKCFSSACGARGNVLDFVAAMEQCSIRDAAIKLKERFAIGESDPESPKQDIDERIDIQRGIYRDKNGGIYEVLMTAENTGDSELVVVYRELFGDYKFRVGPTENFSAASDIPQFRLIKNL